MGRKQESKKLSNTAKKKKKKGGGGTLQRGRDYLLGEKNQITGKGLGVGGGGDE